MLTTETEQDIKTADFYDRCEFFAKARAGVRKGHAGPDTHFATRYFPTFGGKRVRPKDMPDGGYKSYGPALTGVRGFKRQCQEVLASGAPR